MKTKNTKNFIISTSYLIAFVLFSLMITFIDVKPIGPEESFVGFATLNGWMHNLFGINRTLYNITDWASILAVFIALGFAILGLCQWIKRRSLFKVDRSILLLGGFYSIVFTAYLFFEFFIVNYRPILIDGFLEASYPSSTTMLVMCIMPTAMMQFSRLIINNKARNIVNTICGIFTGLMVIGRLLSGVHWFTDILGGVLLSAGLVMFYFTMNEQIDSKKHKQ
ncbi:Phosphoesterase PA-phosphatase [Petrocella atlantisensis]|uniref:Phosphoesterase PA-phosphatase n=1 Tax=Petrocella atlantisensis TaxID=2173034 RepID=A0A3P7PV86_9FIRM|nr:phosphatase PAP2 family protein [Petrocella atlantisensis]VDN47101.1 Phosphoesterase PA-phosphatase [Petrocella atlantisensis]